MMGAREEALLRLLGLSACWLVLIAAGCDRPNVMFPKFQRDHITVGAVMSTIDDLVTGSVSGLPAGPVDIEAACPRGGSAHITGTLGAQDGSSFDLAFDLDACRADHTLSGGAASAALTLDGALQLVRDLEPLTGWGTESYTSDELILEGTIAVYSQEASIHHTCPFAIEIVSTEISGAVVGTLCQRPVSWSYRHAACTGE